MEAPICVAKGVDDLALKIREIGREHSVPIVENPPLARALYRSCEVGQEIPPELYAAVAQVLAFVLSRKAQGVPAGREQDVDVAGLRRALAGVGAAGQDVALQHGGRDGYALQTSDHLVTAFHTSSVSGRTAKPYCQSMLSPPCAMSSHDAKSVSPVSVHVPPAGRVVVSVLMQ